MKEHLWYAVFEACQTDPTRTPYFWSAFAKENWVEPQFWPDYCRKCNTEEHGSWVFVVPILIGDPSQIEEKARIVGIVEHRFDITPPYLN